MKTDDLKPGLHVSGIMPGQDVQVIQVMPSGGAINVFFQKLDGSLDSVTLFESDLSDVTVSSDAGIRSYNAPANGFLLAAEALRIRYSYVFDNRLAMHTSIIEPLPHQITAVYEEMLPKQPLRFLLADDPGAGKTIMAGLLIKELMIRGEVERCLIVCPGSLVQQWVEDEMGPKFGLEFRMLTNDVVDSTKSGNPFIDIPLMVASMDKLARDERVQAMLQEVTWDLVIVDESHKMAAHVNGKKVDYTHRYHLGRMLSERTRNLLLMTATPHNGKEGDFQEYMKLLDRDLFEGGARAGKTIDLDSLMRRLQKEELLTFEGKPLFPVREARTASYGLSPAEEELYEHVTEYVRMGFNRALSIVSKDKRNAVGFALTSLQRRLASSPMAAFRSLKRRRTRLEERATEVREHGTYTMPGGHYDSDGPDWDEWDDDDYESVQDNLIVLDAATAAETLEELEAEIEELRGLEAEAQRVLNANDDRKWRELLALLESPAMRDAEGNREKLIIFTEFTDTMEYLEGKLSDYLGSHGRLRAIRGGMNRDQRRQVEADFKQNPDVCVLVATDAAGEGINLQTAHLLINYDLPWNPNRIEQRFGRIHRIGQKHTCYMYNLVADGTREGEVWQRLFKKLDQEKETLQGKVFDVLGQITYDDKPLKDLLWEAILEDQTPERQAYLDTVIDSALDTKKLKEIMKRDVLATDTLSVDDLTRVRADIERANAMRLQPYYIKSFIDRALADFGAKLVSNGDGTFRLRRVPLALAVKSSNGARRPLPSSYQSLAFDKESVSDPGRTDLVCVGHPLLDAAVEESLAKHDGTLATGTVLIDSGNRTLTPRVMFAFSLSICDGAGIEVDRKLYYVEVEEGHEPAVIRQAPYIDYHEPDEAMLQALENDIKRVAIDAAPAAERAALDQVMQDLVAVDVKAASGKRVGDIDRIAAAVEKRLDTAIIRASRDQQVWATKAQEGKEGARLQADNRKREVKDLVGRKEIRLAQLANQKSIRPKPLQLVASAIVIPAAWVSRNPQETIADFEAKKISEERGMDAVMCIERASGHVPMDVSRENCGWDVESRVMREDGIEDLLFIESKGVAADADTVILTRNEICKAMGNPHNYIVAISRPNNDGVETSYVHADFGDVYNEMMSMYPLKIDKLIESANNVATYFIKDGVCTKRS